VNLFVYFSYLVDYDHKMLICSSYNWLISQIMTTYNSYTVQIVIAEKYINNLAKGSTLKKSWT